MRHVPVCALLFFAACSAPVDSGRDGGRPRPDGFYGEDELDSGVTGGGGGGGAGGGTQDAGPPCVPATAQRTDAIYLCLDQGRSPNQCTLEQGSQSFCDTDRDGLFDDLELALGRAYSAAFAFNGGAFGGNAETAWPANAAHFASKGRLVYRPAGQSEQLVRQNPTLDQLWQGSVTVSGNTLRAYEYSNGPDFFLCLNDTSSSTRVLTKSDMLTLPGGVDVLSVVHPANGALAASTHLFVATGLFFPYNAFAGFDDHEGDWETVAAFVNRSTGAVDFAFFERHSTTDDHKFISAAFHGTKNPATDGPAPAVSGPDAGVHALRFWDHGSARHHLVAYVSTGGHAMFDYPGNTYVIANGPRDTHAGDGEKYAPWLGQLYTNFAAGSPVVLKTQFINPGEPSFITLDWARYKGQWGCDEDLIAKSWPGPFGNSKLARPMFERQWGSPPAEP